MVRAQAALQVARVEATAPSPMVTMRLQAPGYKDPDHYGEQNVGQGNRAEATPEILRVAFI